ncbi:methyltransferase domain-containing protein [Suillus plorans]|uniref:Methyltransferase domain-containing protein n=1 Tax=Suillus plorans TaxID=116603 RepID=A0A9P7DLM8_9AGAM|nr:methyltransferase domain-containing protein [Suillus plorans]KAG1797859.1 methyltransferase domain-containing protein [Suillus plorans]
MSKLEPIYQQLCSPLASELLSIHPNDLAASGFQLPGNWKGWWEWATSIDDENTPYFPRWMSILHYYSATPDDQRTGNQVPSNKSSIPPDLKVLIDDTVRVQLSRDRISIGNTSESGNAHRSYGMSPKKEHEVSRMSGYIDQLLCPGSTDTLNHVVDVGSGQGYLSRALQNLGFHVLALDSNEIQTSGAERWKAKEAARRQKQFKRGKDAQSLPDSQHHYNDPLFQSHVATSVPSASTASKNIIHSRTGSLTHQTICINPRTLESSIHDWLLSGEDNQIAGCTNMIGDLLVDRTERRTPEEKPVPVMMVALHACGSLTPDVLRVFLSNYRRPSAPGIRIWTAQALVVVGCCYNLMVSEDFPLSRSLRERVPVATLPLASRHLAAQIPSQWLRNETSARETSLAIRKVVFRALLQPVLQKIGALEASANHTATSSSYDVEELRGVGQTQENRRLGKLPDAAYKDWETFLDRATSKIGVRLDQIATQLPVYIHDKHRRMQLESALSVLHVLRCIMGPLIESLILLDRHEWIREELSRSSETQESSPMDVELVNLFDQATGSGRNVAIVIKPCEWPNMI